MAQRSPEERADRFRRAIDRGPLLLDAGMGTRLIALGLDLTNDDPCLWNLDRPEEVAEIHRLDVRAGSDAVTTNTFGANANWLARFGRELEVDEINFDAVAIAREAAGPDRFVLGCIGPTAFDTPDAYDWPLIHQATMLEAAGVDALILETALASSSSEIESKIGMLHSIHGLPILLSFALVVDDDPLPPIDLEQAAGLVAVGWNCIPPGRAMTFPGRLVRSPRVPMILQPSGPWIGAGPSVEPTPGAIARLVARGVRLFGGCCGTSHEEIAALRQALLPFRKSVGWPWNG